MIRVPPSRFRNILAGIRNLNGLEVEGFIDRVCKDYNYFSFYSNDIGDNRNNHYTIIKTFSDIKDEKFGKCRECNCGKKRFINEKTGVCFYKEEISNNYTTKIPE